MKKILLATAAIAIPSLAWSTDARMSYTTPSGASQALGMLSTVCGTNSDGDPTQCISGDTATNQYTTTGGTAGYLGYIVPVCSVVDGVPQVCDFSGGNTDLSAYLTTATAAETYAKLASVNGFTSEQHFAYAYFADPDNNVSRDAKFGDKGIAVRGGTKTDTLIVTTSAYVPDTTTTDSTTAALNTESAAARFVSQTTAASTYATIAQLDALQESVTGDLSTSGSSLTMPVGSSGLNLVMSYSASGTGALTAVSASGTLTPVDIYEVAAWGTTSFKGYTLDSGTITTTATTVDSTFYLSSNAWGTYHIGVGGHLYIVDIFGSGAGKRTFMSWRMVK